MSNKELLTQARLKELLHYDPETGVLKWIAPPLRHPNLMGKEAGSLWDGYRVVMISRQHYNAHRLAWLYVYGEWPKKHIDHINGIRDDNRICNLRDVSCAENAQNIRQPSKNNKAGHLGVQKVCQKYRGQIVVGGVRKHLGTFETIELARAAYWEAKKALHKGYVA